MAWTASTGAAMLKPRRFRGSRALHLVGIERDGCEAIGRCGVTLMVLHER